MLKNLFKFVRFLKDVIDANKDPLNMDAEHLFTFEGVDVIYSKHALRRTANIVAGITTFGIILVDDIFMELPEDVQKAILYHEIGHSVYEDLSVCNIKDRSLENEQNADAYGLVKGLSKQCVIDMLVAVKEAQYKATGIKRNKEIDQRIEYIKSNF